MNLRAEMCRAARDVPGFENLLRDWMAAQSGVAEELDTLVCDGRTLRGSIAQTESGAARFIAQVSLYSQTLGVAIAQTTYATDASGEIQALRLLLEAVDLEGVLVQSRLPRKQMESEIAGCCASTARGGRSGQSRG